MIKIKCPICGSAYVNHDGLYSHIDRAHSDQIPVGFHADQYYYDLTHKGKRSYCVVCKKETAWNERTHKYHRLCGSKACNEKIREEFHNRMMRIHGTDNLAKDPQFQRKMLAGRSISGEYRWEDGYTTNYTGTYELDFLKVCENLLSLTSKDVLQSPFTYEYKYNNEKHFYIPDFYLPDLKLEVEIKDGGDNPNMHPKILAVDKMKEKLKDNVMKKQHLHHYIKIVNKKYDDFLKLVPKLLSNDLTEQEEKNKIKIIP